VGWFNQVYFSAELIIELSINFKYFQNLLNQKMMRTLAGWILNKQGWKITGDYGGLKKSVTIFAPHTAHIDYYYWKLGFTELGVKFKFLSKKELFSFP